MSAGIRRTLLIFVVFAALLAGHALAAETETLLPPVTDCPIMHETEFGGVYLDVTIDEFNALGYEYGDSLDLAFSNGFELYDLPYYNGYYTRSGEPLIVAYPGYPYIRAGINNGEDLWEIAGLEDGMTAAIFLNTESKYLDIQNVRNIHYEDDRALYESDMVFSNFRSMAGGRLKADTVYRSASPCDNQHNRAPYADALMKEAGVRFILDLADTDEKIRGYMEEKTFNSPCFAKLREEGLVVPLGLNTRYESEEFREKLAAGLTQMAQHEGPYLIHCTEGKDRTGFVCMLIGALAGADYYELEEDYMITYRNYYGIDRETDPVKYDVIVENLLLPMLEVLTEEEEIDVTSVKLDVYAEAYLKEAGMDADMINRLKENILK